MGGISVSEAWGLFRLLDLDNSGGVDIHEFTMGCLRLKGEARTIDVATMMYENKRVIASIGVSFSKLEKMIEDIKVHSRRPTASVLPEPPVKWIADRNECSVKSCGDTLSEDNPRKW